MPDVPTAPPVKGINCPDCHGVRMFVAITYNPCPGLVVRYRECTACGCRLVTEERVVKTRKSARNEPRKSRDEKRRVLVDSPSDSVVFPTS